MTGSDRVRPAEDPSVHDFTRGAGSRVVKTNADDDVDAPNPIDCDVARVRRAPVLRADTRATDALRVPAGRRATRR